MGRQWRQCRDQSKGLDTWPQPVITRLTPAPDIWRINAPVSLLRLPTQNIGVFMGDSRSSERERHLDKLNFSVGSTLYKNMILFLRLP